MRAQRAAAADAVDALLADLPAGVRAWSPLAQDQYLEVHTLLSGYLLSSQGDRMLMAHSVEGRFPFLDRQRRRAGRVAAAAYKLRVLDEKHVLKRAAARPGAAVDSRAQRSSRIARPTRCRSPSDEAREWIDEVASAARPGGGRRLRPGRGRAQCSRSAGARAGAGQFSNADNMAVVGVLSTQLVHHHFIRASPAGATRRPRSARSSIDWLRHRRSSMLT